MNNEGNLSIVTINIFLYFEIVLIFKCSAVIITLKKTTLVTFKMGFAFPIKSMG